MSIIFSIKKKYLTLHRIKLFQCLILILILNLGRRFFPVPSKEEEKTYSILGHMFKEVN
jgi:hypothetical protein